MKSSSLMIAARSLKQNSELKFTFRIQSSSLLRPLKRLRAAVNTRPHRDQLRSVAADVKSEPSRGQNVPSERFIPSINTIPFHELLHASQNVLEDLLSQQRWSPGHALSQRTCVSRNPRDMFRPRLEDDPLRAPATPPSPEQQI